MSKLKSFIYVPLMRGKEANIVLEDVMAVEQGENDKTDCYVYLRGGHRFHIRMSRSRFMIDYVSRYLFEE